MQRIKICQINESHLENRIRICGWVRTVRRQKQLNFIEINDGSNASGIQIVTGEDLPDLTTGCSISVEGVLKESLGAKQKWEIQEAHIRILGLCSAESYPLQKKNHSLEFLRTIAHLRPRTRLQGAVMRVRNHLAFATHRFFQERGFLYIQTPIITSSDCEGGGQQFAVTTLSLEAPPRKGNGEIDYLKDFFSKRTYLTVSGQLNLEAFACSLSDVYTFGPTFRAENSNTARHLSEFWMIEPEIAFADLEEDRLCAEDYLKFVIQYLFDHAAEDLEFFNAWVEKELMQRLQNILKQPFARLSYTEAISVLQKSHQSFEYAPQWGHDLQTEHERYLAEKYCQGPVIVSDYPQKIKAFYMRSNEDGQTVAAMDILCPKIGEIIGGSQREEREDLLRKRILDFGLKVEDYEWYLALRKYGTVPHSGFGAGFERLVLLATGLDNIRDVMPFPRFPGHADF
jgi:asparaginyl-tRNA synthetase